MSTIVEKKAKASVQPFVVEMTDPRCGDVIIQSIPGCRLRSAIKAVKKVFSPGKGEETTFAPSGVVPGMPELPGMQIHIYPGRCKYKIVDPLRGDEKTCGIIKTLLEKNRGVRLGDRLDGVPPQDGSLEPSRMKTLVRELVSMVKSDTARIEKGVVPQMEEIENLPGRFLTNPGSTIRNSQPRYEDELESWVEGMDKAG